MGGKLSKKELKLTYRGSGPDVSQGYCFLRGCSSWLQCMYIYVLLGEED